MNIARSLSFFKTQALRLLLALAVGIIFGLAPVRADAQTNSPPALPSDPFRDSWPFTDTNYLTTLGFAPLAFTNVTIVSSWSTIGNALWLDSSDPAFLQYNLVETNGTTNLDCTSGSLWFWFSPDWASADDQSQGYGPGDWGRFLDVGAFTTNASVGWWSLYLDPGGTNVYFAAQTNGTSALYLSAPISWASNTWHLVALTYTASNSLLYLDGQLATNGPGVSVWPGSDVLANGFFIGSDYTGLDQARGQIEDLTTWNLIFDGALFTNYYNALGAYIANWQAAQGGGFGMFAPAGMFSGSSMPACVPGGPVWFMNPLATQASPTSVTMTFTLQGGTANTLYDIYGTTNLAGASLAGSSWSWVTNGYTCNLIVMTNQPVGRKYYVAAVEIPPAWYTLHGLSSSPAPAVTFQDPNLNGLYNGQEYLYGGNPSVTQPFSVWVGNPSGMSSLP